MRTLGGLSTRSVNFVDCYFPFEWQVAVTLCWDVGMSPDDQSYQVTAHNLMWELHIPRSFEMGASRKLKSGWRPRRAQ